MLNQTPFEDEIALSKLIKEDIFDLLEVSVYYKLLKLPLFDFSIIWLKKY